MQDARCKMQDVTPSVHSVPGWRCVSETVDGAVLIHPTVDKPDFYRQGIHEQLQLAHSALSDEV